MKNVEKADRIHLGSLLESLKKGHFVVPDFQREFEWEPWDVRDLIKSIFMDYYVGTLLLWKGSKENYNTLSCEPIYAFNWKVDPQHIVLDGQQRLTAIYYAFFQPELPFPRRSKPIIFCLQIQELLEENYEDAFWYDSLTKKNIELLANRGQQFESHVFPLGIMKEGTWGTSDWIKEYRDYWILKAENELGEDEASKINKRKFEHFAENAKLFKNLIEEIFNQYYISYIELDRDIKIDKVCDIFTQINSKGVSLDIFDLLNALLRPKDVFLKKMWHESETALSYTDPKKMKIYILQVMSILEQAYCSSKYLYYLVPGSSKSLINSDGSREQKVLVQNSEEFITRWEFAVKALTKAIQSLKNPRDYGAINRAFVPYPSIIPAFAAINAFVQKSKALNTIDIQTKIRKWYWASVFTNRYSSSVESTAAKDFQDLKKWFLNDDDELEVIGDFISNYKLIDLVKEHPKGSAIYNAIFNLLIINEARDWSTFNLPEYESLDDHHIVPISLFKDIAGQSINSILNRTPLSPSTNRHIIRNRMPNEYIKEMFDNNNPEKVFDVFKSHLISKTAVTILLRNPFTKSDFDEFINERQETIKEAIEYTLIKEKLEIPKALQPLNDSIESIELKLRLLLADKIGNNNEDYRAKIPPHIQEKVDKRILSEIRKKPSLKLEDFSNLNEKLKYFDLTEYYETIISKTNWEVFEESFKVKEQLQHRFNQIGNLRNCIRHSRDVSNIEKLDGEAAIEWFKQILK